MIKKTLLPQILCAFLLFSFTSTDKSEEFGQRFFKLLQEYSTASKTKLKACFITQEALATFPRIEIPGFSSEGLDEFIEAEIRQIDTVAKDFGIVWEDIEYVKTESQIIVEKEINVHLMNLEFTYDTVTFTSQLVGLLYEKEVQLVRIMHIKPKEE